MEARNFSPPPDISLSYQTFYAVSVCQGGKQWKSEADHIVVLGDIKIDWNYIPVPSHISRALSLIKHKNSTKFVFTFLILSCHLCLDPTQNYSLKMIVSII